MQGFPGGNEIAQDRTSVSDLPTVCHRRRIQEGRLRMSTGTFGNFRLRILENRTSVKYFRVGAQTDGEDTPAPRCPFSLTEYPSSCILNATKYPILSEIGRKKFRG